MLKVLSKLVYKRTKKPRERDYGDLRGPLADALEAELALLNGVTWALLARR